jgi:hypothetical protein
MSPRSAPNSTQDTARDRDERHGELAQGSRCWASITCSWSALRSSRSSRSVSMSVTSPKKVANPIGAPSSSMIEFTILAGCNDDGSSPG